MCNCSRILGRKLKVWFLPRVSKGDFPLTTRLRSFLLYLDDYLVAAGGVTQSPGFAESFKAACRAGFPMRSLRRGGEVRSRADEGAGNKLNSTIAPWPLILSRCGWRTSLGTTWSGPINIFAGPRPERVTSLSSDESWTCSCAAKPPLRASEIKRSCMTLRRTANTEVDDQHSHSGSRKSSLDQICADVPSREPR